MLVAVLKDWGGREHRFPHFQIASVADGGAFHIKDGHSFHHWWQAGNWSSAWTEEVADDDA